MLILPMTSAVTEWRINYRALPLLRSICIKISQQRSYLGTECLTADLQFYYKVSGIRKRDTSTAFLFKRHWGTKFHHPTSHTGPWVWGEGWQLGVHGYVSSLASALDGEGKGLLNFILSEYSYHGLYPAGTGFPIAKMLKHGEKLYS